MVGATEIRVILIVGLHSVITTLATGEKSNAILSALAVAACYFIITATVWVSNKWFDNNGDDSNKSTGA